MSSSDSKAGEMLGSPLYTDVYVISWGKGRVASNFSAMAKFCVNYYGAFKFHSAWKQYMKHGGCTINFWKFDTTDKNIKNQSYYKKL